MPDYTISTTAAFIGSGMMWAGPYAQGTSYNVNAVVNFQSHLYVSTASNNLTTPGASGSYWQLMI